MLDARVIDFFTFNFMLGVHEPLPSEGSPRHERRVNSDFASWVLN